MIVSGCINEALYLLLLTHKNLSSLNLLVHCHREREAKPYYCTWTGKHLPPTQVVPSPSYPDIHVQWKHPTVFLQTANGSQLCTFVVHSSISKRKKKIAGVKKKKKRLEVLKTLVVKVKCTRFMAKTLQLSNFKLAKFSLMLLVVMTHELWRRQRKTFTKAALVTV